MEKSLEEFSTWMKFRHLSESTRYVYYWRVRRMALRLRELGVDLRAASPEDLRQVWPDSGASYHNGLRNALISFYEKLGGGNPARELPKARQTGRLPRPYTPNETVLYLEAAHTLGAKYYALACLGVYAGLRLSEAVSLPWDAVGDRIRVRGKGDKDRSVPVSAALRAALTAWKRECPSQVWLFPPSWPRGGLREDKPAHVSRGWVWHREIRKAAGLWTGEPGKDGFHRTRHTFGTAMYQGTKDLRQVQVWMGHSNPSITAVYTQVANAGDEEVLQHAWEGWVREPGSSDRLVVRG